MKKALPIILALVACAAIVFCVVLNNQKGDLDKAKQAAEAKVNEITAKLTDTENLKKAAEDKVAELEGKLNEEAESAKAELESVKADAEAKIAELTAKVSELEAQAAAAADAAKATVEEVKETVTETAEEVKETAEEAAAELSVMTYEQYAAAAIDSEVLVETYVQANQAWWDGKITVYAQSEDGAYFIYNMACSEEDAAKLVPGTKIRVKGFKSEWSGEVEITDATFEIIEGSFIAEPEDVTAKLGTEELINSQNKLVAFKGMTVEAYDESGAAFAYKNAENKTDDLYFKVSKDGTTYDFCVEFYLCNNETEVYKAVEGLKVGDVIDLEGFLYWYNGANPHITKVTAAQ